MVVTINIVDKATGTINVPLHIQAEITGATLIQWLCNQDVLYTVSLDQKTLNFTPSVDGVYVFTVTAGDGVQAVSKTVTVTVGAVVPTPTPTPTPVPTPAGVIYDSRIDSKLHDGKVRTVTQEGILTGCGKGAECRASGDPVIKVNADGTFTLVAGSGDMNNISLRLTSRHNEGGAEDNRFGGFGCSLEGSDITFLTESYHNVHRNQTVKPSGVNVNDKQFHKVVFSRKGSTSYCSVDGKPEQSANNGGISGTEALILQRSYIWLRGNNSDHGRIYIYACNNNARMDTEFKILGNTITFKYVVITAI